MAFYSFLFKKSKELKTNSKKKKVLTIGKMMTELGLAREGVIGTYDSEKNPDDLTPSDYVEMQNNDGEVQAIVRVLSLPIESSDIHILPAEGDKGERDFIETVFTQPSYMGGMTTPLPFLIADMTRAIFEGFRLYEKVARVIENGKYKGKIGWKKLAPRDASTVGLCADKHGGFDGAFQQASFGEKTVSIKLVPEKCILFTFQKEKHWLYGESILKSAYYHYDKKHKLYWISHKKAEIETTGLKILRINQSITAPQREKAETAVDNIGVNSRVTLPPGIELEIERGGGTFDPMPLIEHHNLMMSRSALIQAMDSGKYAYTYGKRVTSSTFLLLTIKSIMRQMEETLNTYAVAPLIDYNFGTQAYPKIKFAELTDETQEFLKDVFLSIMKQEKGIPQGFVEEIVNRTAKALKLNWAYPKKYEEKKEQIQDQKEDKTKEEEGSQKAFQAFEQGKLKESNKRRMPAPKTLSQIKEKLSGEKGSKDFLKKCFELGGQYAKLYGEKDLSQVRN